MIDKPPPELPPKLSDEEKEWQSEIKKQIKQLSDAKEVGKLLKLKERASEVGQHEQEMQSEIQKQIKQQVKKVTKLLKLKDIVKEVGQLEQERKTLDPGQATERKNVNQGQATKMQKPPGRDDVMTGVTRDVPSTRSQGTVPCDTRYVPRQQATVPCEVAKHLHGSQESDRQKIQSRMLTNVT